MIYEIKGKWIFRYKNWNLIITEDNRVFDIETKAQLVEIWNNGTISFRVPKTNKKVGKLTIKKHCVKQELIIQEYTPF